MKVEDNLPAIEESLIDEVDMDNDDMLQYLAQESDEGFGDFIENLLETYPQGDLLQFALVAVMEDEEEEDRVFVREGNKGIMFIALKTIIDCFIRQGQPQP
ncbi:MAG: hypothetical protein HC880_07385 [Bacteroidia bacterium]|nr:hypothetical protein [Bacteroidia bacterium]